MNLALTLVRTPILSRYGNLWDYISLEFLDLFGHKLDGFLLVAVTAELRFVVTIGYFDYHSAANAIHLQSRPKYGFSFLF